MKGTKLLVIALVVFVGYWMMQQPDSLASFTKESTAAAWSFTQDVFTAGIDFLSSLFA